MAFNEKKLPKTATMRKTHAQMLKGAKARFCMFTYFGLVNKDKSSKKRPQCRKRMHKQKVATRLALTCFLVTKVFALMRWKMFEVKNSFGIKSLSKQKRKGKGKFFLIIWEVFLYQQLQYPTCSLGSINWKKRMEPRFGETLGQ